MIQIMEWAHELTDGSEQPAKKKPKYQTDPVVLQHMFKVKYGGK